jgi:hypothetical protein
MKRIAFLIALLVGSVIHCCAQPLYLPRDVKRAFAKGTRSFDGKPGSKYWQNKAWYNITISATPPNRNIDGIEHIAYFNNSPDTLSQVFLKLLLNVHLPGADRDGENDSSFFTNGLYIDSFAVNGEYRPWDANYVPHTVKEIRLSGLLAPGDSIRLFFKWHYELALKSEREGVIDPTTFFLAYCYPRIAVYDDYSGWDRTEFTNLHEFYNDLNDYTVNVKVPRNYLVWATGVLQNPSEVLSSEYVKRFESSKKSDSIVHIVTAKDWAGKNITTQQDVNTWQWKAANVSDIAIAISDHFVWDATSTITDSIGKQRASVQAVYNDTTTDYRQVAVFAKHAIHYFSHQWPGVAYPYPAMTVFQGFTAMEYPMMANVLVTPVTSITRFLIDHEIAHTYFPFYMGINETKYAFMDEGWAVFLELMNGRSWRPVEEADMFFAQWWVNNWIYNNSSESNLPLVTPSIALKNPAYGINAYGKPPVAYLALKDLLGEALFKKCLHGFMERWHGKHPTPWDFFHSFSNLSGKDLNWFWRSWFFSSDYIDVALQQPAKTKTGYTVQAKNIGGLFVPLDLYIQFADGTDMLLHQSPDVWRSAGGQATISITTGKKIRSIELRPGVYVDADDSNNKCTVPL